MSNYEVKQVIVLRKDLNMRKGKMVAQGAHASMAAILDGSEVEGYSDDRRVIYMDEATKQWLDGRFAKICVSVDSEDELLKIHKQAKDAGMVCSLIRDAGFTEFNGEPTYTAVAVGPGQREEVDKITGDLKLL